MRAGKNWNKSPNTALIHEGKITRCGDAGLTRSPRFDRTALLPRCAMSLRETRLQKTHFTQASLAITYATIDTTAHRHHHGW